MFLKRFRSVTILFFASVVLVHASGCASFKSAVGEARDNAVTTFLAAQGGDTPERIFAIPNRDRTNPEDLLQTHAPVVLSESDWSAWNRVGTPGLYLDENGDVQLRVDPTISTLYAQMSPFTTASGKSYRNLIYRVHFERVPQRFKPLMLSAGKNVGLIFIATLNEADEPVLYTTTHTCGCYTAIVPTSALDESSLPDGWTVDEQLVHQEKLPGMMVIPSNIDPQDRRVALTLRDSSHRVARIAYESYRALSADHMVEPTTLASMQTLDKLRVEGASGAGTESMFDEDGYVRDSRKPLEFALLSWWTFDKRVGQDKRLSTNTDEGTSFYTSLDYRQRENSDMRDFARFLEYRGFKL